LPGVNNNKILCIVLIGIVLTTMSCWYYSFTERPYPHIENTFIETFDNETDRYDLGPLITEGLISKLQGSGLLKIIGRDGAQSIISGTIRSCEREAYTYTSGEVPVDFIVRVRTQVSFYDVKAGKTLWQTTLEGFATYPADESTKDEAAARDEAAALLVERIIDRLREG